MSMNARGGIAFIHGGMHGGWCWDRVRALTPGPTIAPDLPGRGARGSASGLRVADFVAAVVEDIERTCWEDVVLVAHSLGGLTAVGVANRLPSVRHVIFVSCLTPPPGTRPVDALPQPLRAYMARRAIAALESGTALEVPRVLARRFFCSDLSADDLRTVLERCVPEPPATLIEPTPSDVLPYAVSRTWVHLTKDRAIPLAAQERMRANVQAVHTVEIPAGHDAMLSRPAALAAVVHKVANEALPGWRQSARSALVPMVSAARAMPT